MSPESENDHSDESGVDPFAPIYERTNRGYGETPSAVLSAFLSNCGRAGKAFDLGAGAGRDTFALLKAGFEVECFDQSEKGLARIQERAEELGLGKNVQLHQGDVRDVEFPSGELSLLVATTILDHVPASDAQVMWQRMCDSLVPGGYLYVEVHTTDDPACESAPAAYRKAPASETADAVINYFAANQLASWAILPASNLQIRHYEERLEWDTTHGADHLHGKAILLAERVGAVRQWYGEVPLELPPPQIRSTIAPS